MAKQQFLRDPVKTLIQVSCFLSINTQVYSPTVRVFTFFFFCYAPVFLSSNSCSCSFSVSVCTPSGAAPCSPSSLPRLPDHTCHSLVDRALTCPSKHDSFLPFFLWLRYLFHLPPSRPSTASVPAIFVSPFLHASAAYPIQHVFLIYTEICWII